jgi:hypothetical protein
MNQLHRLVDTFANDLTALIEQQTMERARAAVVAAFGKRGPGRPPAALVLTSAGRPRKKPPVQLCPVPGCKNPAAPVFGMVCAAHKGLPKAKIKKYREARRAAKAKGTSNTPKSSTRKKPVPAKTRRPARAAKRSAPRKVARRRATVARKSAPKVAVRPTEAMPAAAPAAA